MNRRLLLAVALAGVLGAAAGVGGFLLYERQQSLSGAMMRPAFQLPDLDDRMQSVEQWDGKLLVLNFWGTWCPPCVHEIPIFIELQREYGARGLQIVGIAIDDRDKVRVFADEMGVNYPILYGVQSALDIARAYRNDAGTLPYTVVIDRLGAVRHIFPTDIDRTSLENVIQAML